MFGPSFGMTSRFGGWPIARLHAQALPAIIQELAIKQKDPKKSAQIIKLLTQPEGSCQDQETWGTGATCNSLRTCVEFQVGTSSRGKYPANTLSISTFQHVLKPFAGPTWTLCSNRYTGACLDTLTQFTNRKSAICKGNVQRLLSSPIHLQY